MSNKPKIIEAGITLNDKESARAILKELSAPVTDQNVLRLKVIITELGEMFAEGYNDFLVKQAGKQLAAYSMKCECGRPFTIDVTAMEDLFNGGYEV